jgi:hypothetical protein
MRTRALFVSACMHRRMQHKGGGDYRCHAAPCDAARVGLYMYTCKHPCIQAIAASTGINIASFACSVRSGRAGSELFGRSKTSRGNIKVAVTTAAMLRPVMNVSG